MLKKVKKIDTKQLTIILKNTKIYIRDKHIGSLLLIWKGVLCVQYTVYILDICGVFVLIKGG